MGRKITVDSATLMNKGLEIIEAHWLFGPSPEQIEVVVHPQSVIHSLVEYVDGSMLAQLGHPDMRTPIAHALAYPERMDAGVTALELVRQGALTFEAPDPIAFPASGSRTDALRAGGTAPAILNAANEVAVAAFLEARIRYMDIAPACAEALARLPARPEHRSKTCWPPTAMRRGARGGVSSSCRGCLMDAVTTIVAFVVALGLLIVFHEYGHYLRPRFRVKVLRFSVGFGRPLLSRRAVLMRRSGHWRGFPLGGYVKMLDEREGPVAPAEAHRAFNRQSVYKRFVIVAAGPIANFLLAILLYWGLFSPVFQVSGR